MTIKIENISKKYKKQILSGINLEIKEKTIYGLLGRNGIGKSTLLNIINNRTYADSGEIYLDNQILTDNIDTLNKVYLMSEDNLFPGETRVKNMFKITEQMYGNFDWDLCQKLILDFGVNINQRFRKVSTGYRSIIKLIIALCVPCDYIFMDEPVLGLDANHRELFYDYLIDTYEDRPRTFVISTHIIDEVTKLLEEVIIIEDKKVISQGNVEELLASVKAVSGEDSSVREFIKDLKVLNISHLGNLTTAYIQADAITAVPDDLTLEKLDLQTYFIQLTSGRK